LALLKRAEVAEHDGASIAYSEDSPWSLSAILLAKTAMLNTAADPATKDGLIELVAGSNQTFFRIGHEERIKMSPLYNMTPRF